VEIEKPIVPHYDSNPNSGKSVLQCLNSGVLWCSWTALFNRLRHTLCVVHIYIYRVAQKIGTIFVRLNFFQIL